MGRDEIARMAGRTLGDGGAVALVGAAGVGKTTMIHRILRGRHHVIGQSLPSLADVAYLPLSQASGRVVTGAPNDVAADMAAALRGTVLVVEDLHWADRWTLDALMLLVGRVPVLVSSRIAAPEWSTAVTVLEVPPMERRHAAALAHRQHPGLSDAQRHRLVDAAGGNPLLVKELAQDGHVSRTLVDAMAHRVAAMSSGDFEAMALLALFGRPAGRSLIGLSPTAAVDASGLLERQGELVSFTHAAIADAVLQLIGPDDRRRLHALLAARCDDDDAARHHLLAGDAAAGAAAAERAAARSNPARRAALLSLAVEARGDAAPDRLLLDAAQAALQAHQPLAAERFAARVTAHDDVTMAEALWHRAQAGWLDGDLHRAELHLDAAAAAVEGSGTAMEAHVVVERAMIAARIRVGDPSTIELASSAVSVSEATGIDRAKAKSALGLALSHNGMAGWEQQFAAAVELARQDGDDEQECAAWFWATSSFGLYGPMSRAIEIDDAMVTRTAQLGQRRWHHHFVGARAVHRSGTGNGDDTIIADARRLLDEDPLFRNRAQVDLAIVAGLVDLGDLAGAQAAIDRGRSMMRNDEERSLLAVAAADLALARSSVGDMADALAELASCTRGFFGMNAAAESAAVHLAVRSGAAFDVPRTNTRLLPLLDVAALEHDALDACRAGDVAGAARLFADAARTWTERSFVRFAGRAWCSAATGYELVGDRVRADRSWAEARMLCERWVNEPVRSRLPVTSAAHDAVDQALSPREVEVLRLVGRGATTAEIACELGIGRATVETHIRSARHKLGASTRGQAAALAARLR